MNNQIEIKAIFGKMTCKYMQYKKQMFSRKTKHNAYGKLRTQVP